ncbi:THAP domain-containing protein 1-like [Uloborus diversus]|uniref:THAP domain-containing protein 1-like n=1 Tax=Uloborus diversus TaxID=327109 RepID=UPI00240A4D87|nr:THAP domain-containing protein 1-like [Uloborus diversus]
MRTCCIPNCSSRYSKGKISFHEIPSDSNRRKLWLDAINKGSPDDSSRKFIDNAVVCRKHFKPDDFKQGLKTANLLKQDAVPSIFPHSKCLSSPRIANKIICCQIVKVESKNVSGDEQSHILDPLSIAEDANPKGINVELPDASPPRVSCHYSDSSDESPSGELRNTSLPLGNNENLPDNSTFESSNILALKRQNADLKRKLKVATLRANRARKTVKRIKNEKKSLSRENIELIQKLTDFSSIENQAAAGSEHAIFILDQVKAYHKKTFHWSTEVMKNCLLWQKKFPRGYKFVRDSNFLKLPGNTTLKKFQGLFTSKSIFLS